MTPLLPVQSSMLSHIAYDPAVQVLGVRFNKSNFVHHFVDVPPDVAAAVFNAESIGKAFNEHIRGKYHSNATAIEDAAATAADAIEA